MKDRFAFLQYCIDPNKELPDSAKSIDWLEMMAWAEEQAIVGVIYGGIEKAGKALNIPFDTLMEWIGYAQQIETRNRLVNKRCADLMKDFEAKHWRCCIIKGQSNGLMYPNALLRTSGDIDVVVFEDRRRVAEYVRSQYGGVHENYIHIDYPVFEDEAVEIHFWPSYSNNPIYNRRFQKWFNAQGGSFVECKELPDNKGVIPVSSNEFNIIYQLMHMMHHFFDEGLGLRQVIDYYYLLKSRGRYQKKEISKTLKYLNLYKFAGAVMYVLKEVLGVKEQFLLVPVDEKRGKTLLREILEGGNFGRSSGLTEYCLGVKFFIKTWRVLHFVREYPSEALCEPVFRTWHFFWRELNNK